METPFLALRIHHVSPTTAVTTAPMPTPSPTKCELRPLVLALLSVSWEFLAFSKKRGFAPLFLFVFGVLGTLFLSAFPAAGRRRCSRTHRVILGMRHPDKLTK